MTSMLERLSDRVVTAGEVAPGQRTTTLDQVRPGGTATIVGVESTDQPTTARRLFDLGSMPGVRVEVLPRAPRADPLILRVAGYELALRKAQARLIEVSAES